MGGAGGGEALTQSLRERVPAQKIINKCLLDLRVSGECRALAEISTVLDCYFCHSMRGCRQYWTQVSASGDHQQCLDGDSPLKQS